MGSRWCWLDERSIVTVTWVAKILMHKIPVGVHENSLAFDISIFDVLKDDYRVFHWRLQSKDVGVPTGRARTWTLVVHKTIPLQADLSQERFLSTCGFQSVSAGHIFWCAPKAL
eukprot:14727505-Alexandrium_andersonii.AAC.1